jgi:hypothetical protein
VCDLGLGWCQQARRVAAPRLAAHVLRRYHAIISARCACARLRFPLYYSNSKGNKIVTRAHMGMLPVVLQAGFFSLACRMMRSLLC